MPRAGYKPAENFSVSVTPPNAIYLPGDTVNGQITLPSPSPSYNLHLNFYGRSKVLIIRSHGEGKDYYRGRAIFFETQFFLTGPPVSQPDGSEIWPFTVEIPTHTVPGEYKMNDKWKKAEKYLDNHESDVSTHPLPGVFYYCGDNGGSRYQCYVEYVIEISTRPVPQPGSPEKKKEKKPAEEYIAVIPLVVRTKSTEHPIQYFDFMQEAGEEVRIKTLKLLPQFAAETLGFRQSLKSVFQPSKIPNYFFDLRVSCPSKIQLDNPSSFPFRLSVLPKADSERRSSSSTGSIFSDGDASKLPDVKIMGFSLCLKMWALMRAKSVWSDTTSEKKHDFVVAPELPVEMVGYVIPREGGAGVSMNRDPGESNNFMPTENFLDLGQLLNLQISRTHSTRLEGEKTEFKTKRPLWPSFKTYNIQCYYEWKYKVTILCAGETEVVEGKQRVELLGQSEEQEQDIKVDKQGVPKKWRELMEGAEGVGGVLGAIGEAAAELGD